MPENAPVPYKPSWLEDVQKSKSITAAQFSEYVKNAKKDPNAFAAELKSKGYKFIPNQPTPPPTTWWDKAKQVGSFVFGGPTTQPVNELGAGFLKGGLQTIEGLSNLGAQGLSAVTGIKPAGGQKPATQLISGAEQALKMQPGTLTTPTTPMQKVGAFGESVAELFTPMGEEKGAALLAEHLPQIAEHAPQIMKFFQGLLKRGVGVTKFGVQEAAKSGDVSQFGEGLKSGAIAEAIAGPLGALVKAYPAIGKWMMGLPKDVIDRWSAMAKDNPELLKQTRDFVKQNAERLVSLAPGVAEKAKALEAETPGRLAGIVSGAEKPFQKIVDTVASGIKGVKENAKAMWDKAYEVAQKEMGDKTFDLENKIPDFNKALEPFGLTISLGRDSAGRMTKNLEVKASGKISPDLPDDIIKRVTSIANDLIKKDLGVQDLKLLDDKIKNFVSDLYHSDFAGARKLAKSLTDKTSKLIDEYLPGIDEANQEYRKYYQMLERGGNKIIDAAGNVKSGAEGFIQGLLGKTKGTASESMDEIGKALNIDIRGLASKAKGEFEALSQVSKAQQKGKEVAGMGEIPSQVIEDVQKIMKAPGRGGQVMKNIIRGIEAFGIPAAMMSHPVVAVPTFLSAVLTDPQVFAPIFEKLASLSEKSLSNLKAGSRILSAAEKKALQSLFSGKATAPGRKTPKKQ